MSPPGQQLFGAPHAVRRFNSQTKKENGCCHISRLGRSAMVTFPPSLATRFGVQTAPLTKEKPVRMLAKGDLVGRAWAAQPSDEPLVKVRMAGSLFFLLSASEARALAHELTAAADAAEVAVDQANAEAPHDAAGA